MTGQICTKLLEQGVTHIFSPLSKNRLIMGTAAIGMGSLAISRYLSPELKKLIRSPQEWQVYRLIPSTFYEKKFLVRGAALLISAMVIYATYPYLGLFLNNPFPKSFSLRLRSTSENSVIALIGTGILLGTGYKTASSGELIAESIQYTVRLRNA